MANIAIVFDRSGSQTVRVAHRIAHLLRAHGHRVEIGELQSPPALLHGAHGILVGSGTGLLGYPRCLRTFVREHVGELRRAESWLFTVERGAAEGPSDAGGRVARLAGETGWWPRRAAWFDANWGAVHDFADDFSALLPPPQSRAEALPLGP